MQVGNIISRLTQEQLEIASSAGDNRIDYIEFMDVLYNKVINFEYQSVVFVHSIFPSVMYYPDTLREEEGLNLICCPIIKGIYKLYINEILINGQFIVLTNEPDTKTSHIEFPESFEVIAFYENLSLTFILRDQFGNFYSSIEEEKRSLGYLKFDINLTTSACSLINVNLTFEPLNLETNDLTVVQVKFFMESEILTTKQIKISGLALDKRRKEFLIEIEDSINLYTYQFFIRRMNFLEDLLEWADKKMNYRFRINFQDEHGIDAGGLGREFYDMIGNTLKDEKYKFFSPTQGNPDQYFLDKNFNKLKNKEQYALLFGKLIANSIGNKELIGIDIASVFWKVVYDQQIQFEDLQIILDKQSFENYNGLQTLSNEILESLCLDFTYQVGNKTIELIPNGSKTEVNNKNLNEYLNKTAEYIIFKQFETIYAPFIEGFQSVIDINIFKKWLKPNEISLFTQGLSDIKAEIILQKISYEGGQACHKSYYEMYISQASAETLKKMLKFITGTSSIPFDQSSYIIKVQFESYLDISKLPVAHTCFHSIEVPLYQNYAQLKQKLDIAFTIGLEGGFGIG